MTSIARLLQRRYRPLWPMSGSPSDHQLMVAWTEIAIKTPNPVENTDRNPLQYITKLSAGWELSGDLGSTPNLS